MLEKEIFEHVLRGFNNYTVRYYKMLIPFRNIRNFGEGRLSVDKLKLMFEAIVKGYEIEVNIKKKYEILEFIFRKNK